MPLFVGMGITKLLHACPVIGLTALPPLELKVTVKYCAWRYREPFSP